jgi:hypothetical protein
LAFVLGAGGVVGAALADLDSLLAAVPLSLALAPSILALLAKGHRSVVLPVACLLKFAVVVAAGFTVGLWFMPCAVTLTVAAFAEAIAAHEAAHEPAAAAHR